MNEKHQATDLKEIVNLKEDTYKDLKYMDIQ